MLARYFREALLRLNPWLTLHILLPQMEHIIRQLVEVCGDTVTYLKEDGTEEYKSLSQLFKSQKLLECYDGYILFTLYSIMDDPCGKNLRNLNAHGLLEPRNGNGVGGIYFMRITTMLPIVLSPEWSLETRGDTAVLPTR